MKKWLIIVMTLTLFIPFISTAQAQDDITGHQYEKEMRVLNSIEIMKGDGNGTFSPDRLVTRAEFAAFIARALKLPEGSSDFKDVNKNDWYYKPISQVYQHGLIQGIGGNKFGPNQSITREQMATLVDRAFEQKGIKIELKDEVFPFSDIEEGKWSRVHVQRMSKVGVMNGVNENSFEPERQVNRAETANTIYQMLDFFIRYERGLEMKKQQEQEQPKEGPQPDEEVKQPEKDIPKPIDPHISDALNEKLEQVYGQLDDGFTVLAIDRNSELLVGGTYQTLANAKSKVVNPNLQFIVNDGKIVWMGEGLVLSNGLVILYKEDMETSLTYVASNSELKYLDSDSDRVKVQIAETVGYVNPSEVQLIPEALTSNRSYYQVKEGKLVHSIYMDGRYHSYMFGPAPSFMREGERSFSWDGKTFSQGTGYHYFNYLPLHTKTSYTAEQLDEYVRSKAEGSPLIGLGKVFKQAEEEVGVNALYLLSHAIHESAWGFSKIAQDKHNLFGIRATDSNPYGNATGFNSFEDSIMYAANYVKERYLTPGLRTFYNGASLGNKSYGMNVYYASDPYWGQKIAGHMYKADEFLGIQDWNKHQLAITKVESLNVRAEPEVGKQLLYEYKKPTMSMIVLDRVQKDGAVWYKIASDDPKHPYAYVYGDGSLGKFVEPINW